MTLRMFDTEKTEIVFHEFNKWIRRIWLRKQGGNRGRNGKGEGKSTTVRKQELEFAETVKKEKRLKCGKICRESTRSLVWSRMTMTEGNNIEVVKIKRVKNR